MSSWAGHSSWSHAGLSLLLEERRPGEGGGAVRGRPRALALPAALIASVAQAACLGLRDATTPGLSVAIAAVLNLMGDFVLVPRQGLLGAAIATAASQYAAALLLILSLKRKGVVGRACFAIKDRLKRYGPFACPLLQ